jgi:plasmid replication initiation protein
MASLSAGAAPPSQDSSEGSSPTLGSDFDEPDRDKNDIVVKANQLIRGRINWTKLEHRVVAMLVAQLKQEDDTFEMQRVHISDLMDMAQISSRDIYSRAEEVCRKLLNQKVHVRTRTEDGRRMYQGYNCLSTCRYVEGSGYIEAKFNDDMKPFLLQLKRQFTMYRLQNFMQLSSQHSMRMYELIKMQEGLRHLRLSVDELREVLCCEHTYERFSDFRRHVLERARTEIEETCDTYYTYAVERDGRTPKWVRFLIHRREDEDTPTPIPRDEGCTAKASGQVENGAGATHKVEKPPTASNSTESNSTEKGSPSSSPSSPLRRAEGRYNLYVSVLARLTQETLDNINRSTLRSALNRGKAAVAPVAPDATPTAVAEKVVRRVVAAVQEG